MEKINKTIIAQAVALVIPLIIGLIAGYSLKVFTIGENPKNNPEYTCKTSNFYIPMGTMVKDTQEYYVLEYIDKSLPEEMRLRDTYVVYKDYDLVCYKVEKVVQTQQ